jgi:rare lipoprotein A
MNTHIRKLMGFGPVLAVMLFSGCADTPHPNKGEPNPIVGQQGMKGYKIGKPYQVKGQWYRPQEDFNYSEVGDASWYGRQFHGKHTANGEIYDMNAMTAAHRTLPLPSMVRVTNLNNGRSVKLRVNDRGPFANDRIIDVSRRAAQMLGFKNQGITRVRVEIVAQESRQLAGQAGGTKQIARNDNRVGLSAVPQVSIDGEPLSSAMTPDTQTAGSRTYVQAGAFSKIDNANRVRAQLSGLGPVQVRPLWVNGQNIYRVRLGPLSSHGEASGLLAEVVRAGYPGSHIVNE